MPLWRLCNLTWGLRRSQSEVVRHGGVEFLNNFDSANGEVCPHDGAWVGPEMANGDARKSRKPMGMGNAATCLAQKSVKTSCR